MFYTPNDDCAVNDPAITAGMAPVFSNRVELSLEEFEELLLESPCTEMVAKIGPLLRPPPESGEVSTIADVVFAEEIEVLPVGAEVVRALPEAKEVALPAEAIKAEADPGEEEKDPPFIVKFPHVIMVLLA